MQEDVPSKSLVNFVKTAENILLDNVQKQLAIPLNVDTLQQVPPEYYKNMVNEYQLTHLTLLHGHIPNQQENVTHQICHIILYTYVMLKTLRMMCGSVKLLPLNGMFMLCLVFICVQIILLDWNPYTDSKLYFPSCGFLEPDHIILFSQV